MQDFVPLLSNPGMIASSISRRLFGNEDNACTPLVVQPIGAALADGSNTRTAREAPNT
jgi:hypothetical protein